MKVEFLGWHASWYTRVYINFVSKTANKIGHSLQRDVTAFVRFSGRNLWRRRALRADGDFWPANAGEPPTVKSGARLC